MPTCSSEHEEHRWLPTLDQVRGLEKRLWSAAFLDKSDEHAVNKILTNRSGKGSGDICHDDQSIWDFDVLYRRKLHCIYQPGKQIHIVNVCEVNFVRVCLCLKIAGLFKKFMECFSRDDMLQFFDVLTVYIRNYECLPKTIFDQHGERIWGTNCTPRRDGLSLCQSMDAKLNCDPWERYKRGPNCFLFEQCWNIRGNQ